MSKLDQMLTELRTLLEKHFAAVRLSAVQTSEQMLAELRAVMPDALPAVIVVFDGYSFSYENTLREIRLTLVLVDRFRAGSDDRALSVFQAAEKLLELFPATGRDLTDATVYPVDCVAASPDKAFACLALGIVIKQGI